MKKIMLVIGVILAAVFIILLIFALIFFLGFAGGGVLYKNPQRPAITYGEFPISVTCEIDGAVMVIKDIVICEYDGVETLGEAGKYRKWKAHLKSGNKRLTLLSIDETSELYCWYGSPDYYMDDLRNKTKEEYEQYRERNFNSDFIAYGKSENGEFKGISVSSDEAWERYRFRVVDVKYTPPIQNSFK